MNPPGRPGRCPVQSERDVRVKRAQRGQITWGQVDLDAELPADHEVRAIAAVVDKLDLRGLYFAAVAAQQLKNCTEARTYPSPT